MKDFAESFEPDTQVPRKEKIVSTSDTAIRCPTFVFSSIICLMNFYLTIASCTVFPPRLASDANNMQRNKSTRSSPSFAGIRKEVFSAYLRCQQLHTNSSTIQHIAARNSNKIGNRYKTSTKQNDINGRIFSRLFLLFSPTQPKEGGIKGFCLLIHTVSSAMKPLDRRFENLNDLIFSGKHL